MKEYKLLQDLPHCPAGRIFKQDLYGNYYHAMTDEEHFETTLKQYQFNKHEILLPEWFEEITEA